MKLDTVTASRKVLLLLFSAKAHLTAGVSSIAGIVPMVTMNPRLVSLYSSATARRDS